MNRKEENRSTGKGADDQEFAELNPLLRQVMPPLPVDQLESRVDLWPRLRARIDSQSVADSADASSNRERIHSRVPWFDWALAVLATAALLFFPGIIPALLYHF